MAEKQKPIKDNKNNKVKDKVDDDDEEDPDLYYINKAKQQEQQQIPENDQFIGTKTFTQNIFQQRGLQISDEEVKKISQPKQQTKDKQNKKEQQLFNAQDEFSLKELETELKKSVSKQNYKLSCSLLSSILNKPELNNDIKIKYALMRCQFLKQLKQYDAIYELVEQYLDETQVAKTIENIHLLAFKAAAEAQLDDIWNGYMNIQRAAGMTLLLKKQKELDSQLDKKPQEKQSEDDISWLETDSDKLLKDINEILLQIEVKIKSDKKSTADFIYSSGFSSTGGTGIKKQEGQQFKDILPQPIPQLRNRVVLQVSCGDNHTLALVSGCSCQSFFIPNFECKGKEKCNGGPQVFGWGQNVSLQITADDNTESIIQYPVVLKQLQGKQISGVFAFKTSSLAFENKGIIYEWGHGDTGVKSMDTKISDLIEVQKGNDFYAALSKQKQLWILGKFTSQNQVILEKEQAISYQIGNNQKVQNFFAGCNHIIVCTDNGKAFALGDNSLGQLGIGEEKKYVNQFYLVEYLQNTKIAKVNGHHDCTFFISESGTLYYSGQVSQQKTVFNPKEAEFFEDDVKIFTAHSNPKHIYALDYDGKCYMWEIDQSVKFKQNKQLAQEHKFRNLQIGNGFQIYQKTMLEPEYCSLRLLSNPNDLKSYERIEFEVQLKDRYGKYSIENFYPFRYHIIVSDSIIESDQLIEMSQKFTVNNKNLYAKPSIYINQISQNNCVFLEAVPHESDKSIHLVNIKIVKKGSYYMYLLLNECVVQNCPIKLNLIESNQELEKIQKNDLEDKIKRDKGLEAIKRQEQLNRELELEKQQIQKQMEEEEKEKNITSDRAQENLNKFLKQQKEQKLQEEIDRQAKKDLITGGGFDLNKQKQSASNQPVPQSSKQQMINQKHLGNGNQPGGRKLSYDGKDTQQKKVLQSQRPKSKERTGSQQLSQNVENQTQQQQIQQQQQQQKKGVGNVQNKKVEQIPKPVMKKK